MMDGLAAPKMQPLMKMSRSCTSWLCVIGDETCEAYIASEVGISFGVVQSILYVRGLGKMGEPMLMDWLLLKSRQWVRLGKYIIFDCGIAVLML